MNIYGYLQLYLYLEFNNDTVTICSINTDFSKEITEEVLQKIVDAVSNLYHKKYDINVRNSEYVSKEAYELFIEKFGTQGNITIEFNENSYEVKEVGEDYGKTL